MKAITTQHVRDAIRVCGPNSLRTILRRLAKGDEHAARDNRRRVIELLKRGAIERAPGPGRADGSVLIAVRAVPPPAPESTHAARPIALPRTPPRIGRWRPPMSRERPPHLIPVPALQPQWPAIRTNGALAPRISGGFIHG